MCRENSSLIEVARWNLLRMRNAADRSLQTKSKHTFYIQLRFYRKLCLFEIMWRGEHQMHCCFSTATVVTRTRAIVTLYVHCLFLLWLSLCNTSEVRKIRHMFCCACQTHFALVMKFCEHLIDFLIRRFKELSWDQQTSEELLYWSVKPFHLLPTFSHSISDVIFQVASFHSVYMTKFT